MGVNAFPRFIHSIKNLQFAAPEGLGPYLWTGTGLYRAGLWTQPAACRWNQPQDFLPGDLFPSLSVFSKDGAKWELRHGGPLCGAPVFGGAERWEEAEKLLLKSGPWASTGVGVRYSSRFTHVAPAGLGAGALTTGWPVCPSCLRDGSG